METYYKQLLVNEKFITELSPLNKIPVNKGVLMRAIRTAMNDITGSCSLILMKNIFDNLLNLGVITKTCISDSERYSINLNNKKGSDDNDNHKIVRKIVPNNELKFLDELYKITWDENYFIFSTNTIKSVTDITDKLGISKYDLYKFDIAKMNFIKLMET